MAAEKAEAERLAAAEASDAEAALNALNELKGAYGHWREGAVTSQVGNEGKTLWKTKPEVIIRINKHGYIGKKQFVLVFYNFCYF